MTSVLAFFPGDTQMPLGMAIALGYAIVILLLTPYIR
jgi:hypothetical protein